MKRVVINVCLGILAVVLNSPAFAFEGEGAFYDFLQSHPQVKQDLERNPNLVNDPSYLESHPQFKQFYRNHGEVRDELRSNADDLMRREETDMAHPRQHERDEARWKADVREQREEANTDKFMDSRPEVQRKLDANPNLANDPAFLKAHPGFEKFEGTHPGVQQQLREHPRKFMSKEDEYERHH